MPRPAIFSQVSNHRVSYRTHLKETTISIDSQFNGPPDHANGGYLAGVIASFVRGPVEITINNLVPLGKKLIVRTQEDVTLHNGDTLLAEGKKTSLKFSPPIHLTFDEARKWSDRYKGNLRAVQKNCFVCGSQRKEGDGLRVFPGHIAEKGPVAAAWIPP